MHALFKDKKQNKVVYTFICFVALSIIHTAVNPYRLSYLNPSLSMFVKRLITARTLIVDKPMACKYFRRSLSVEANSVRIFCLRFELNIRCTQGGKILKIFNM